MESGRNANFKPGTVVLVFFIAGLGLGMFNWSSAYIETVGEDSSKNQDKLLKCSNLELEVLGIQENSSHTTAFFKTNSEVEKIYISFIGDRNVTKEVENSGKGKIQQATAEISQLSGLYLKAENCSKIFGQ